MRGITRLAALAMVLLVGAAPVDPTPEDGFTLISSEYQPGDFTRQAMIGNGRIGGTVPALGQGYEHDMGPTGWPVYKPRYTGTFLAGLYTKDPKHEWIVALPTWSTVKLDIDGAVLAAGVQKEQLEDYQQKLDMKAAVLTTTFTWKAGEKRVKVQFDAFISRHRENVATIKTTITPQFDGTIGLEAILEGEGSRRVHPVARGTVGDGVFVDVATDSNNKPASLVSIGKPESGDWSSAGQVQNATHASTAGQRWVLNAKSGQAASFVKTVGIASADDGAAPRDLAAAAAKDAAAAGVAVLRAEHDKDWAELWTSDVTAARPDVRTWSRASLYNLYSNMRAGTRWSIAPSGISSDTYAGMIFWDAETWMYPSLLALHPELAKPVLDMRFNSLEQARKNAIAVGRKGAVWNWSTGPSSECNTDGPCLNTQDHLQADISMAQWQYFLATGDKAWLRERGWPVIKAVAEFWAARLTRGDDGKYHTENIAGADEYAHGVKDHVLSNVGAINALRHATTAAQVIGETADPSWTTIADNTVVPIVNGIHPEYQGYNGVKIKQADTVMLTYPQEAQQNNRSVAQADLDFYAPLTDPDGPAMTDSIHAIVAAYAGSPGCQTWTYLQRAAQPFLRGPFQQFAEARGDKAGDNAGAPAWVFSTGAGGYLQSIIYGLTGQRWRADRLVFDPLVPPQLADGVDVKGLRYQGRIVNIHLDGRQSTLTLVSGDELSVETTQGLRKVKAGQTLKAQTRRPDLDKTDDLARCTSVTADNSGLGSYPDAAIDGSVSTTWRAASSSGALTVDLGTAQKVGRVEVRWGAQAPTEFGVRISTDRKTWTDVSTGATGNPAVITVGSKDVRFVQVDVKQMPGNAVASISSVSVYR